LKDYKMLWNDNSNNSLDQLYSNFLFKINSMKNNFKVKVRVNEKFKNNWMTDDIYNIVIRKDKLFKKVKRYPSNNVYLTAYKCTSNYLKTIIKLTKEDFYCRQFNNCNSNKEKWDLVNKIVNNKNTKTILPDNFDDIELSHRFNHHFSTVNQDSCSPVTIVDIVSNLHSFVLFDVTHHDVSVILKSFTKNSCDYDGLNFDILRYFSVKNMDFITNFINLSFSSGIFPDLFKLATVIPIHKSGSINTFSNYRPISILPIFSKLIEKIMYNNLYGFLQFSNFFSDNQYGFIKNRSTTDALLKFSNFIYSSIDNNKKTLAVFLDISKAFDSVNHLILLNKLHLSGIRGISWQWFKSYLANRKQRVKINDSFSDFVEIGRGVPQGSILGPLLFLIFINDLCNLHLHSKIISYADDTVLLFSCDDLTTLKYQIENDLQKVNNWFLVNDLQLNLNKTKYMFFSLNNSDFVLMPKFHVMSCSSFSSCSCHTLQQTKSIKYLGLHIDSDLKWKTHIKNISTKLRFVVYNFYYLKKKVPTKFLISLYYSWFYSIFNYGSIVWGTDYKTNLHPVCSLQNKIFKILNGGQFCNDSLFRSLNLLPIRHNAFFRVILFLFNNRSICNLNTHTSNRRPNFIFQVPLCKKTITQKHFLYLAPKCFNSLPLELQSITNYYKFKRALFELFISIDDIDSFFKI